MSKYQNLFEYISYFENISADEVCHWGGGSRQDDEAITVPYPIYDKRLRNFIDEVCKSDLIDFNYIKTLENNGLSISNKLTGFIDSCDLELLKAILTCYVRQERFCDGLWALAVKDNVFYKLLVRLNELEKE